MPPLQRARVVIGSSALMVLYQSKLAIENRKNVLKMKWIMKMLLIIHLLIHSD